MAPHPDADAQEMNNHHDPLALVPGVNCLAVDNDNECNTDALLEFRSSSD